MRFTDWQNELSEVLAIAGGSVKSADQELSEVAAIAGGLVKPRDPTLNTRRKGPLLYYGLTATYGAGDILLQYFANSKLDITVAQYITTSKKVVISWQRASKRSTRQRCIVQSRILRPLLTRMHCI